jgi:hypothetical protein
MFIKIFLNGYEFITTTTIMVSIPLFYYAIKNRWPIKLMFTRLCAAGGGMLLAAAVFVVILSLQYVLDGQSFSAGFEHVYTSFLKRSHAGIADAKLNYSAGVNSDLFQVLKYYFTNPAVLDFRELGSDVVLKMKHILILFFILTSVWTIGYRKANRAGDDRKTLSLCVVLWISALAPISWFVIFKGHSFIHKVHDPIVWYMPFMFYGLALTGFSIEKLTAELIQKWRLSRSTAVEHRHDDA